jgi:tellurite resistance protein
LRAQNEWNEQKIEQLLRYNEELERVDRQEIEEQTQTVQQMQTKLEHEK